MILTRRQPAPLLAGVKVVRPSGAPPGRRLRGRPHGGAGVEQAKGVLAQRGPDQGRARVVGRIQLGIDKDAARVHLSLIYRNLLLARAARLRHHLTTCCDAR